ncbi:MAG: hydantoinase/oxoprolinase family protein [Chromatiales bacterium]|nr:hydantoinase/oxoprolinase family protein [Chromatiales bacterium]
MIRLAFDIGGTFTDIVLHDANTKALHVAKTLTTPDDLARAVLNGLNDVLSQAGRDAGEVGALLHATTVATNAILERAGAKTALLTTKGFRDVLILGRQKRYETYNLYFRKPEPLTRRQFIYEVEERVDADGAVVTPLDTDSLDVAIDQFTAQGIESVAIVFLHAYINPTHERAAVAHLRARAPQVEISASSEVSPRIREYERTSTTLANAYVKPIVARYLDTLEAALARQGFTAPLHVMQSNGGLVTPAIARDFPVRIVESGPAAGVLLARHVGQLETSDHVLTFDMGGTTAKLGVVDDGEPAITSDFEVDTVDSRRYSGLPLSTPAIELLEIGAGGGSIATTDGHTIQVGPSSAGADPGPICYGSGGDLPTVTDANLVLGYLDPGYFNGGAMTLDLAAAKAGLEERIAAPLGLSTESAAWGIHAVANANMERAMRVMSVEKGRDPRKYTLVAFGGAGPIHAAHIARSLAIPRVIVPAAAGVGSAVGLLTAQSRIDVTITRTLRLDAGSSGAIAAIYAELQALVAGDAARLGSDAPMLSRYAYLRQAGQGFEIVVALPDGEIDAGYASKVLEAFHAAYQRDYGYRDEASGVEAVDWCLAATLPDENATRFEANTVTAGGASIDRVRDAYFPDHGGWMRCRILNRSTLRAKGPLPGPAIVEDPESTILVLPGDRVALLERGDIVIDIRAGE